MVSLVLPLRRPPPWMSLLLVTDAPQVSHPFNGLARSKRFSNNRTHHDCIKTATRDETKAEHDKTSWHWPSVCMNPNMKIVHQNAKEKWSFSLDKRSEPRKRTPHRSRGSPPRPRVSVQKVHRKDRLSYTAHRQRIQTSVTLDWRRGVQGPH